MPAHDCDFPERAAIAVELATSPEAIREAQALRHQVFCRERKLFTAEVDHALDQDEFDAQARHVVVRCKRGDVIAASRVVAGQHAVRECLPMHRYCTPSLFDGMPMNTTGEISRFAISKQARLNGSPAGPVLRLSLFHGILAASREIGLTHWCALMEPSLTRLLAATGVNFVPFGPSVEAFGLRRPYVARIDHTVAIGRSSHPHFYDTVMRDRVALAA